MVEPVIIGNAELWLGDCRDVLPTLGPVDAVVTDAPFGIADAPIQGQDRSGKRRGAVNTWHPPSDWDAVLDPAWGPLVCNAAPIVAWFGQWRKREEVSGFMPWLLRAEIVWAKDCHMGPPSPVAPRDERIWLFAEHGINGATFETSVWDCAVIPTWAHKHHKNEKPVPLMKRLIRFLGAETVCDPFAGSGSTGVAAVQLGKRFIGIERDPKHFATACRRIEEAYRQADLFIERPPAPKQEEIQL